MKKMKIPCWTETHRRMKWRMAWRTASLPIERWTSKIIEWKQNQNRKISWKTKMKMGRRNQWISEARKKKGRKKTWPQKQLHLDDRSKKVQRMENRRRKIRKTVANSGSKSQTWLLECCAFTHPTQGVRIPQVGMVMDSLKALDFEGSGVTSPTSCPDTMILDALKTHYHKSGIGNLLISAPNIIEEKNGIDEGNLAMTFISNEDRGNLRNTSALTGFKNQYHNKGVRTQTYMEPRRSARTWLSSPINTIDVETVYRGRMTGTLCRWCTWSRNPDGMVDSDENSEIIESSKRWRPAITKARSDTFSSASRTSLMRKAGSMENTWRWPSSATKNEEASVQKNSHKIQQ